MILLLDTSTPVCKLMLIDGDVHYENEWQADRQLAKGLLAYLHDQLELNGKSFKDVTGIGTFEGPGSFTGLRIGLTVLNTIADAEKIPIVGARGDQWQQLVLQKLTDATNERIVLPFYGSDAHITTPRK
jgi:tRNA threonylcarbamoyladenosine biosynthesis protein TsaB